MKNYRIIKGVKIHVNQLASMSRKYTVSNTTKSISPVVEHKREVVYSNPIVNPLTGNKFDQVNPHPIPGRFGITVTGYDWIKPTGLLWKNERHKQPKRLIKCKARKYSNWKSYAPQPEGIKKVKRTKRNDFINYTKAMYINGKVYMETFPNYPYTIKPMCKEAYMEKLVAHKLEKWNKKNPKPNQDLFDKVEDWEQRRFNAEQRFRDFVVSCYNKLDLNGRFKQSDQKYTEENVAKIKDINMEGHRVNELDKDSKLLQKAQKITNETKKKKPNLVATNLKDHKKQKGRIILPKAA